MKQPALYGPYTDIGILSESGNFNRSEFIENAQDKNN